MYSLNYAAVSSMAVDPIEKKPLFHFYPGSLSFSMGSVGCNFRCPYCQNWSISQASLEEIGVRDILPEEAINMALANHCKSISWTYNEPTMWFEYTYDSAKLAQKNDLKTVYVTNGFLTPEALDTIGPYLDAWRVDIKGFTDGVYRKLARIKGWRGILDTAERARHKWNMHVEVVTNVIPTVNDDDAQLADIARWVREKLGALTPWHVTRFYPHRDLTNLPPTPVATLEKAYAIGKEAGLRFVYLGNVPGHSYENTMCYNCGTLVIERSGYHTKIKALKGTACAVCGADLNIRNSLNIEVEK